MSIIRVAIAGATGYAGEELIRLLLAHPSVQLTCLAASAKWDRPTPVGQVFPRFARRVDLSVEALDPDRVIATSDAVFLALPHGSAMSLAPRLIEAGKRVVDLSGDFRLHDPDAYPRWYHLPHTHPEWLRDGRTVYGLPEFHRDAIAHARLVANPGCYATSILLATLPLFEAGLIDDDRFIVDAKSGLSGAGRKADTALLLTEMADNLRAYKVNTHQHMPEVLQEIATVSRRTGKMTFVPQVIPASRGLMSTVYVRTRASADAIAQAYTRRYTASSAPFVRIRTDALPQLKDVVQTNYCDIGWVHDPAQESLIVMSAIDNLTKGAAGQAVQNFNLMHGLPETAGLM